MAMMGTWRPVPRSFRRMAAAASRPFISGICTSIRMASNWSPTSASIASRPLAATVTRWPCFSSIRTASFRFTALSSASRIRRDLPIVNLHMSGKAETASVARAAFDAESSSHHGNQPRRDGQAKAGASKAAGHGAVRLREGFEDGLLLVERDANSGVANGELDGYLVSLQGKDGNLHGDFTMLREFDAIAREVQNNLAQTNWISDHEFGHVRPDNTAHTEALPARRNRDQLHGILNSGAQAERNHVQIELTRFDLGKVQNVVDHGQEGIGRAFHGIQVVALLGG